MPLFPQQFIDDLKHHADIVVVIGDYVSLKKTGATYKGLCPFHGEKTPSFHVNRDKGFFHCFGCGVGGDVLKFLELHDKVGFADAVKQLAQRFGMTLPELEQNDDQRAGAAERETLLKIHESAAAWFRQQLAHPRAPGCRALIESRGVERRHQREARLGFAPPGRDQLKRALLDQGYSQHLLVRAGLLVQRDDGTVIDRFRNRLMIPICRDTGAVIAFGGRALEADQQPKYLNSPETPIYSKSRTLYGLNLAKAAIRQGGFAVMVEGYFDFAQVFQSGVQAVVASCGTALTPQQAQYLGRFTKKVVLSFDPDAAGQGATVKSCEMLVEEGFDVNVATLPAGQDPDTFIQRQGAKAYGERLKGSQPYLEYSARSGRRQARPEDRRGPGQVPRGHAAHRRPHTGCHDAGSLRGPAGVQGERHGRRGARRDQEGRGPASDHDYPKGRSRGLELCRHCRRHQGGERAHLAARPRPGESPGRARTSSSRPTWKVWRPAQCWISRRN